MEKVDHFFEFVNRPYSHQDVAYGNGTLKLDTNRTDRTFVLSEPDAEDFQIKYEHLLLCKSCKELRTTLIELETAIKEHSQSLFT
jgi:hypothetical protein